MKASNLLYVASLCFIVMSCNPSAENHRRALKKIINNDSIFNKYDKIVLVSTAQCNGCVIDKLTDLLQSTSRTERQELLFVLDTNSSNEDCNKLIEKNFTFVVTDQDTIEKFYKKCSNYIMFKKMPDSSIISKKFYITGDTTKMASFFNF